MKAKDLKAGDSFTLKGKRKLRTIKMIDTLSLAKGDKMPKEFDGKILIIFTDCKQMTLDPDHEVIVKSIWD